MAWRTPRIWHICLENLDICRVNYQNSRGVVHSSENVNMCAKIGTRLEPWLYFYSLQYFFICFVMQTNKCTSVYKHPKTCFGPADARAFPERAVFWGVFQFCRIYRKLRSETLDIAVFMQERLVRNARPSATHTSYPSIKLGSRG